MQLPVAPQSYLPDSSALYRAVQRADLLLAQTAGMETALAFGQAICHPPMKQLPVVNAVYHLHLPTENSAEQIFTEIDSHFAAEKTSCLAVHSALPQWPKELVQAAESRNYRANSYLLLQFQSAQLPSPPKPVPELQIIPARAACDLACAFLTHLPTDNNHADTDAWHSFYQSIFDETRLELFLAKKGPAILGSISLLTLGDIGIIGHHFVLPQHRHQELGRHLFYSTIDLARRAQLKTILLKLPRPSTFPSVPISDLPASPLVNQIPTLPWYLHHGFSPVLFYHDYLRLPG